VLPPEWFPNLCPTNLGADPNLDGAQQSKTELLRHAPGIDLEGRTKTSRAQLVRAIDKEGPCLDCYRTGEPVVNQDLASAGGRWPCSQPKPWPLATHQCTHCRCDCVVP
jgi:hypothetical protein